VKENKNKETKVDLKDKKVDVDIIDKELNKSKKNILKDVFSKQTVKSGSAMAITIILVIAIAVVINLVVAKCKVTADLSSNQAYTLSEQSKELLKKVDNNITIYYVSKPDEKNDKIFDLVKKYEDYSDKVKIEEKDPVVYPNFVKEYTDEGNTVNPMTGESSVTNNSLVVKNTDNNKAKYISYNDLLQQTANQMTMQQETTGIDVEGKVASAINFVTSGKTAKMYMTKSHQELAEVGQTIKDLISKQNMETAEINLLGDEKIPDDCDVLLINGPQKDFTKDEVKKVKKYIDSGNTVFLSMIYTPEKDKFENLKDLLDYYCLKLDNGLVCEDDSKHYLDPKAPYLIIPEVESNELTSGTNGTSIVVPQGVGFKEKEDKPKDITVSTLLKTTDKAYSFHGDAKSEIKKGDDSKDGPFILGAYVEKKVEDKKDDDKKDGDESKSKSGKLYAFASAGSFCEGFLAQMQIPMSNIGNSQLFIDCVKSGANIDSATAVSIPAKKIQDDTMTVSADQVNFWTFTLIVFIPLTIFVVGTVIWYKRRKK